MSSSHDQPTSGWANEPIHQDPAPIVTSGQGIGTTVTLPEPLTSPPLYQELAVPAVIPTVQQTHPTRTYCNETWKVSCKRNALVQGVSGFLCIALGFISVGMECVYSDTGIAIWSGVWIVFSAFLGVSSVRHPGNTCVVTTYMIFSFFSIACSILIVSVYCAAAIAEDTGEPMSPYSARVTIDAMLALVGFIGFISAVIGCVLSAKKTCRNDADDIMIQRQNYYVSHLGSEDIQRLQTSESVPPQYQPDFHPLQVPSPPQYSTFESPPPYEVPDSQSQVDVKKNTEHR